MPATGYTWKGDVIAPAGLVYCLYTVETESLHTKRRTASREGSGWVLMHGRSRPGPGFHLGGHIAPKCSTSPLPLTTDLLP